MDLNFHYYVTYSAACQAGFSPDDALLIAQAARYVDEYDGVTVQSTSSIFFDNIRDSFDAGGAQRKAQALIWPAFHFLPGDYASICGDMPDGGDPSKLETMLICGPESRLTNAIVQGAKQCYAAGGDREKALLRIGITMHALADTFAHQGFAGVASRDVNEVNQVMHITPGKGAAPEDVLARVWYKPGDYSPAPSRKSFGYLGHGRIGTCLDVPSETLHYLARWHGAQDPWVTRYNPLEFYCAYLQMIEAMRYILSGDENDSFHNRVDRGGLIDQRGTRWAQTRKVLIVFLHSTDDEKLAEAWRDYTKREPSADKALWAEQPYRSPGGSAEQKQRFLDAAKEHLRLVLDACKPLRDYISGLTANP